METIQNISDLSQVKVGLMPGMMLAVLGIIFYTIMQLLSTRRIKKFSDIDFSVWWDENQVSFVLTLLLCSAIFAGSYISNTLTVERCFMIGFMGQFGIEKIMKIAKK